MTDFFCPLPYMHQFVCTDGTSVCCRIAKRHNLNIVEFEKSDYVDQIRKQLDVGVVPLECFICKNDEDKGYYTIRKQALNDFGQSKGPPFQYFDLRYDNLCNLACRMCNSSYSSLWAKEIDSNPKLLKFHSPFKRNNLFTNILENFDIIKNNIKKLSLTGGEPLLIKDHLIILVRLVAENKTDVEITITTHLTALNPNWLDIIHKFNTVHWTVSIDAVGKVGEYIRWPNYSWDTIDANLSKIFKLKQSIAINCTLSVYSLLDLNNLIDFFKEKLSLAEGPYEIWFSVPEHPDALTIKAIPEEFKEKIMYNLNYAIEELRKIPNHQNSINTLEGVYTAIQSKSNMNLVNDFFSYTKLLDESRDQNFFLTFKELI
jgi:sulfatase maturation enzyme AslB (radical SAM superfamily)